MSLADKAVIVELIVHRWSGLRVDPLISNKVNYEYNTKSNSGSFSRNLFLPAALARVSEATTNLHKFDVGEYLRQ